MPTIIDLRDFCRANRDWLLETTEALVDARVADDRQGRRRPVRRRARRAARGDRRTGDAIAAKRSWRSPARGIRLRRVAGSAARPFRHRLAGRPARPHAAHAVGRPPARPGRVRHEGRHRDRDARHARAARDRRGCRSPHRHALDDRRGDRQRTSRAAIEDEARRSSAVLVLEPSLPGGALKTSRKGCGSYQLTVHGVSAHAGIEPQKGASAVQELAHQILRVNALQDLERGISVNVVQVSGGLRSNVIPDEARAIVDVRVPTASAAAEIDAAFRGLRAIDSRTTVEAPRRHRPSAAGTHRPRGASVQAGARRRAGAGARPGRRRHRRRLGREFHRRARGSNIRRPRRRRRRRARPSRTRRHRELARSGGARGRAPHTGTIVFRCQPGAATVGSRVSR